MLAIKVKDLIAKLQQANPEDMVICESHPQGARLSIIPEKEVQKRIANFRKVLDEVIGHLSGGETPKHTKDNVVPFKTTQQGETV